MPLIAFWPDGCWERVDGSIMIAEGACIKSVNSELDKDIEAAVKEALDAVNIRHRD